MEVVNCENEQSKKELHELNTLRDCADLDNIFNGMLQERYGMSLDEMLAWAELARRSDGGGCERRVRKRGCACGEAVAALPAGEERARARSGEQGTGVREGLRDAGEGGARIASPPTRPRPGRRSPAERERCMGVWGFGPQCTRAGSISC